MSPALSRVIYRGNFVPRLSVCSVVTLDYKSYRMHVLETFNKCNIVDKSHFSTYCLQSNEPSKEIVSKKPDEEDHEDVDSEEEESHSESEQKAVKKQEESGGEGQEDDEEQWAKYQEEAKKEQQLDTKAKESHPVHCPYFPEVKSRVKH